jgi:hypothetical protein
MSACAKPLAEQCARNQGHGGNCSCPHDSIAHELRAALTSLVLEAERGTFHLRKAARTARRTLEKTAMRPADFEREIEEGKARRAQKLAAAEANPFDQKQLLANLKAALPQLERLLDECIGEQRYVEPVYRLYHRSFKVGWAQETTREIVAALQALAPGRQLNEWLTGIVNEGTGRALQRGDNDRFLEVSRPMLEALFHARFFLEMAVRYSRELHDVPATLPSGWAALLYLYDLR